MSTSSQGHKAVVIETRYVWGKTITEAMNHAMAMEKIGWRIQGNPVPMFYNGEYGTGVSISRQNDD